MTYEAASDVLVDALRAIALQEVTAALAATLGADHPAVRETRGFPFSLDLIERTALPAMFISAERVLARPTGKHLADELVTIAFEYVAPATPLQKLDTRWPLLRAVWGKLRTAVRVGEVAGAPVLEMAGVQRFELDSPTADFSFASDGSNAYPYAIGRMQFHWREPTASTAYTDLVDMLANINRVDASASAALQPQVQVKAAV